jgi:hypothetical protein
MPSVAPVWSNGLALTLLPGLPRGRARTPANAWNPTAPFIDVTALAGFAWPSMVNLRGPAGAAPNGNRLDHPRANAVANSGFDFVRVLSVTPTDRLAERQYWAIPGAGSHHAVRRGSV